MSALPAGYSAHRIPTDEAGDYVCPSCGVPCDMGAGDDDRVTVYDNGDGEALCSKRCARQKAERDERRHQDRMKLDAAYRAVCSGVPN